MKEPPPKKKKKLLDMNFITDILVASIYHICIKYLVRVMRSYKVIVDGMPDKDWYKARFCHLDKTILDQSHLKR